MSDPAKLEELKRRLRVELIDRRRALDGETIVRAGERIAAHVAEVDAWARADTVALYAANDGEPDLRTVFERGRVEGKAMLLPRCNVGRRLTFHRITEWRALRAGRFGLLEPPSDADRVETVGIDLVLAPAVAVDQRGARLGRGGGWYDRAFPRPPAGSDARGSLLVAVVHGFQVVPSVPRAPDDRLVDAFVSEQGFEWSEP
jgi:5-formyltetrahydrofolate cyclo-ligase